MVETLVHTFQKAAWAIQAVDEIAGKDQVIARKLVFQIAGIALPELHAGGRVGQAKIAQTHAARCFEFAFGGNVIANRTLFFQRQANADEARAEVDAVYFLKVARQFKRGTAGGAAQIEGAAFGFVA